MRSRRDVENAGEFVLLSNDAAAAGVKCGAAGRPIVAANGGARLERHAGDALHPGLQLHDMGRALECARGRGGIADLGIDADVRPRLVPNQRCVRRYGVDRLADRGQRLEIDRDAFGGILRGAETVGHHHRDGLAGKPRLVGRKHAVGGEELVGRIALAERDVGWTEDRSVRDRFETVLDRVRAREHGNDAGHRHGGGYIYAANARMGVGRAHHDGIGLAGQVDVVAETALPGEELRIFLADDGLPDGGHSCAFRHRFPPATIAAGKARKP